MRVPHDLSCVAKIVLANVQARSTSSRHNCLSHGLARRENLIAEAFRHIEDGSIMRLRDYKSVSMVNWSNIEEGRHKLRFV